MRNYFRVQTANGLVWVEATTDANGFNDLVYLTNLIQVLQLQTDESPLYGNWGIPAEQSILQQVWPDFDVTQVQQQFAPYFALIVINKVPKAPEPTYNIFVITHAGARLGYTLNAGPGVLSTQSGQPITFNDIEIEV